MNDKILRSPSPNQRILKQDQVEAAAEALSIVEQARIEAQAIVDAAHAEAARVRAEARDSAYADGLAEWNLAVQRVLAARDRFIASSEPAVIKIAMKAAAKIVGGELQSDPAAINRIVEEAMRGIRAGRAITIAVHPSGVETVRAYAENLESRTECRIRVTARDSVPPGGCIVESELGVIDARLEVQLRCLEQILLRELET